MANKKTKKFNFEISVSGNSGNTKLSKLEEYEISQEIKKILLSKQLNIDKIQIYS